MDINSKIKWIPGTVLNIDALNNLDNNLEQRRLISIRASVGNRFGLLPEREFSADGMFAKGCFEIPALNCIALLPSGNLIDIRESVSIRMPKLSDGVHYCCAGYSGNLIEFEHGGLTYERPQYAYTIQDISGLEKNDVFPIVRFQVADGICTIDNEYIPPCLLLSCDKRLIDYKNLLIDKVSRLEAHKNLTGSMGKDNLFRIILHLRSITDKNTPNELLLLTSELMTIVGQYIVRPYSEDSERTTDIPVKSLYDVEMWIKWLIGYLDSALTILDTIVPSDSGLDIEALKKEITDTLHQQLRDELSESIATNLRTLLNEDINGKMSELLKDYLDGTFRAELHNDLSDEIQDNLQGILYSSLYQALYNALFVPDTKEEDIFMPLI